MHTVTIFLSNLMMEIVHSVVLFSNLPSDLTYKLCFHSFHSPSQNTKAVWIIEEECGISVYVVTPLKTTVFFRGCPARDLISAHIGSVKSV